MYKWVAHYVKTCETRQRVKPSGHASAPLQSLPVPADCWTSMSLDFVFGLPADDNGNTRGVGDTLFHRLGTELTMSTADHPQTDGQTEPVNRVLEDTLRSICAEAPRSWSDQLPMVEFALNNEVHASTGFNPFYLNGTPPGAANLARRHCGLHRKWGEALKAFSSQDSNIETESLKRQLSSFTDNRLTLISRRHNGVGPGQTKEYADKRSRGNLNVFMVGDLVLLDTKNLPLRKQVEAPLHWTFAALARHCAVYIIDLPKSMATHPTFYVGRLQRYHDPLGLPSRTEEDQGEGSPPRNGAESSGQPKLPVSKSVNDTQTGTHASHTKGMTVQSEKNAGKNYTHMRSGTSTPAAHKMASDHAPHGLGRLSPDGGGSRSSVVNTPIEIMSLTTKSVQISMKYLKGPRLASMIGSLTARSKPNGYLDRAYAITKLTDLVA
ncbi:LOW QUALITY PROTEIN: Pol protein [Phytophthora palmivora]|uniref:Pol protein n=1 Tax=Phytophthora palmivora TaxID=4796 RepID=A0A2P4XZM4_9STRA|nr:LOW QUALITY PROTEIN: Pol protein [Phytophthora palmivora]